MSLSGIARRVLDAARGRRPADESATANAGADLDAVFVPTATVVPAPVAPEPVAPEPGAPRRSAASDAAAATFVASVRHLPFFSGTAMQLMRGLGSEETTQAELVRLISTDASLVAHLLRIVNSPFFGLAHRVGTVGSALSVLGVNPVRRLVSASLMQRPLLAYLHDTDKVRAFWRHELLCAALSRHLAAQQRIDGELAYMAGLMHDVGRLAMLMQYPQSADVLLPSEDDDVASGVEREYAQFGFDHAQAGGGLLTHWGLPPSIAVAAYRHVDAASPTEPMSACVWQANRIAHEASTEPGDGDTVLPWMTAIGMDANARGRMFDEIDALESDQSR